MDNFLRIKHLRSVSLRFLTKIFGTGLDAY